MAKVLGSSSFHGRSKLGVAIKIGDLIYGETSTKPSWLAGRSIREEELHSLNFRQPLRIFPSIHTEQFDKNRFTSLAWQVTSQMDRSGYRIDGDRQMHNISIPSLPVLPGSIQITPSGQPIVTMNDGPTVGGYPLIATIHPDDIGSFAQHPPGNQVNFEWSNEA